jgi:hypothetical protein
VETVPFKLVISQDAVQKLAQHRSSWKALHMLRIHRRIQENKRNSTSESALEMNISRWNKQ